MFQDVFDSILGSGLSGKFLASFTVLLVFSVALVAREGWRSAFVFNVGWRHLRSRAVSWIAITIIVIVVMLYLVFISVLEGFKEHHMKTLRSVHAHMNIRVGNLPWGILHPEGWSESLKKADPRIRAVTISLETPSMMLFNEKSSDGKSITAGRTVGRLRGIDLGPELEFGGIKPHLKPETVTEFGTHPYGGKMLQGCIVTESLRRSYHLKPGDMMTIIYTNDKEDVPLVNAFIVVGVLENLGEFQDQSVYVDRKFLAGIMENGDSAKTLSIWVAGNPDRADLDEIRTAATKNVMDYLKRDIPDQPDLQQMVEVETWREKYGNLYYAISRENQIMRFLMAVFLLFVAIIIALILSRMVAEKTRDIGALRALGASRASVTACFLAQGMFISLSGLGIGLPLSLLFISYLNPIEKFIAQISGVHVFPASDFLVKEIPTLLLPGDITLISILTLSAGLAGALLPSLRAGKLNPVECLRYE